MTAPTTAPTQAARPLKYKPLTDAQWNKVKPLLPAPSRVGRPRTNDRIVLDGILYQRLHGCPWRMLPQDFGNSVTCWRRARRWQQQGVLQLVVKELGLAPAAGGGA